ncbi:MAG: orotidine-5'-phosphate decarboxylase [Candidatus Woesearchaeota archaeon]
MNYLEKLRQRTKEVNNIICVGLDPDIDKIPSTGCEEFMNKQAEPGKAIAKFYIDILNAFISANTIPAIVKPNIAFYEQYGFKGLLALKDIIDECKRLEIPVLLDAKRGDIGKTSKAYAKALFEFWKADAITIAPYMGSDSVGPFLDYCGDKIDVKTSEADNPDKKGKGVYVLVRTSNKGAVDLQNLLVCSNDNTASDSTNNTNGKPVYMKTAEKLLEWHKPGVGAVIGATYLTELEQISSYFIEYGKQSGIGDNSSRQIPMLIPGVGAQGGSAKEVVEALKKTRNELAIHRINSSSGINYAYLKKGTDDYCGAAVDALKELIEQAKID